MTILFLRHAESIFNVDKNNKLKNCSITKKGIEQSKKIEIDIYFDLLICSPLKRTIQTLEYSNIKYKKIIYNKLFREFKTDICDFFEDEEIIYENEEDILNRINECKILLNKLKIEFKNILIIGHADFFWYLSSEISDNERFGTWLDNCEIINFN